MTRLPDLVRLRSEIERRFGLAVEVSSGESQDGRYVDIRAADLHVNDGFAVRTTIGWRHVSVQLQLGGFAADLLRAMSKADKDQKARFAALSALLIEKGGRISMAVSGTSVDPSKPETWPSEWRTLALTLERGPLLVEHDDPEAVQALVLFWGGDLFGMAVTLLPLEDIADGVRDEVRGLPEGALERVVVNRYERNRINRTLCIDIHGATCAACGADFSVLYGALGRGFIHVHHVVPVSRLGPDYVIDPAKDLVPVCPNCHAMLHRQTPPLDVSELRRLLEEQRTRTV